MDELTSAADRGEGDASLVLETGIALVHEGELVLKPAAGHAAAAVVADDARTSIQYYFPVEIEVVAGPPPVDHHALAQLTLAQLATHLESSG
jgi:hypothetical protein